MKINITYLSGPARYTTTRADYVDYMVADISALNLDADELYAEVDPYSFLPQMDGTDKLCEIYPEYEEIIRDCDPQDTSDLNSLSVSIRHQDRDFDEDHFWDQMMKTFLWEADKFTESHLRKEIINQANALGISPDDIVFPS